MVATGSNRLHYLDGHTLITAYHLPPGRTSRADVSVALDALGFETSTNVITVVGGAAGAQDTRQLADTMDAVVRAAIVSRATIVYGGTESGVLAAVGAAVRRAVRNGQAAESQVPLLGVAAIGTLMADFGDPSRPLHQYASRLQRNMSALITMPGLEYGDESRGIAEVSDIRSRAHRSATVLVNGGTVTEKDAVNALVLQNPHDHGLFVVRGSGRAADAIADVDKDPYANPWATSVAASPRTRIVVPDRLEAALTAHLQQPARDPQHVSQVPELSPEAFRMHESFRAYSSRRAFAVGRMHADGFGRQDARDIRAGRHNGRVAAEAHLAWINTAKSDRVEALDRLANDAKQSVGAMPAPMAYELGARLHYWATHDREYDIPRWGLVIPPYTRERALDRLEPGGAAALGTSAPAGDERNGRGRGATRTREFSRG